MLEDLVLIDQIEVLALKAGGAVLGLIVFSWVRKMLLGIGKYNGV